MAKQDIESPVTNPQFKPEGAEKLPVKHYGSHDGMAKRKHVVEGPADKK